MKRETAEDGVLTSQPITDRGGAVPRGVLHRTEVFRPGRSFFTMRAGAKHQPA